MQAVAQGDDVALEKLLSRFEPDVRRMVGRLTAWSSEVEDLVQDVFIQAWRQAGTYQGQGSLRGWLLQIALNRCRNHNRAAKRIWRKLLQWAAHAQACRTEAQLVDDPRWVSIQTALARLSYSDRELLVLVYMEQQAVTSLAQRWAITESNVYVRLHRARKRLAALIEKDE